MFTTISLGSIALWGVFATGVLTLVMAASQGLGWSRISFPFMIGTAFTTRRRWAMLLGFTTHFAFGCGFALLYALVFESWDYATWWLGLLLGAYHGLFILVVIMPALPSLHPRMAGKHHGPTPTRQLEPPGFLALNYGKGTPYITFAGHVAYGVIIGTFYQLTEGG